MGSIKHYVQRVRESLSSPVFFWLVIAFFMVQSAWIAVSALYPQAFDEQFHFGIIQVYSHHWLPFLKGGWPNAAPFGAVNRDPSFFYHYVMSFPYRLIELFTHDQTEQIIILRLLNAVLFTSGLVLFRRVLRRAGLSDLAINVSTFIATLIPVAPQLAGQINYDNLLIPLTAWACLLTFNVIDQLKKRRFTIPAVLGLLAVCLISSITKYEFLPIFLAIMIFVCIFAWGRLRGMWTRAWRHAVVDWRKANMLKWLVVAGFIAAAVLFIQRDVGNVIRYHTVVPDCSQVLNIQQCSAYGVWIHDYESHQAVADYDAHVDPNPLGYFVEWGYWLWYRLFFAINGPAYDFRNYPPLPLPAAAFALLVVSSVVALVARGRKTFTGKPYLQLLGLVVAVYLLTLFGAGYQKYLETGVLELMNGRYLFPILLPGAAVAVPALIEYSKGWNSTMRYSIMVFLMVCFLEGGGVFTFIARSNHTWYWKNTAVMRMNDDAKNIVEPLLIDGPQSYSTSRWLFN